VNAAIQTALAIGGYALPVDPVRLADESIFQVRHILRTLDLDDQQVACAEQAVALVLEGSYPKTADAIAARPKEAE
jgi:hypothetical protein